MTIINQVNACKWSAVPAGLDQGFQGGALENEGVLGFTRESDSTLLFAQYQHQLGDLILIYGTQNVSSEILVSD